MSKKITSTILLFAVFIGFLWWGLSLLLSPGKDAENIEGLPILPDTTGGEFDF